MIAKLSEELASELDRNGNRPLSVEHPQTHQRYVIVSADEYVPARPVTRSSGSDSDWTEEKNARRFALIDKDLAGQLLPEESAELAVLQDEMDDFLRRVAPLPLEAVRALHEQLVQQALARST